VAEPAARTVTIAALGGLGHGLVKGEDGVRFVPGALPGETVRAAGEGEHLALLEVLDPSPERIPPICPLFGACGGCAVQHWAEAPYRAWKRELVAQTLARAGVEAPIAELVDGHGAGRRRVTLHGRKDADGVRAGFMRARSHALIAVEACPVLAPALARAPEVALALTTAIGGPAKPLTVLITASQGGLDVDVRGHGPASEKQRMTLTALAERLDLARLSLHGDVIVARREAGQVMGAATVLPPPGGFLQPTAAGEAALAGLVDAALPKAKRVADLFAGSGPFALRLAARAEVHAVEADPAALAALSRAARATAGLRPVTIAARDLFRRPMLASELKGYDAVVLDPPRAGAEAQSRELARSAVPRMAYVSCDPATFARDAATLIAGGYTLEAVTPIDQFRYSHHVELVGVFARPVPKKR
jgi:23S rRNA (uracil1939-C5)-methyltransferase